MFDFKIAMGWLAVVITLIAYGIYIYQSIFQRIAPQPAALLGWGFITGTAYLVQIAKCAGAGSWVVGLTALFCIVLGAIGLLKDQRGFSRRDWLSLLAGLLIFAIYLVTKQPTLSAVFATAAFIALYYPIFEKGWSHPEEDSVTAFSLNSMKFVPSLFAMSSYSVATCLYPAVLVFANAMVAVFLIVRRRQKSFSVGMRSSSY